MVGNVILGGFDPLQKLGVKADICMYVLRKNSNWVDCYIGYS